MSRISEAAKILVVGLFLALISYLVGLAGYSEPAARGLAEIIVILAAVAAFTRLMSNS